MGHKPCLLSCSLTAENLKELQQNASLYYLQVTTLSGTTFTIATELRKSKAEDAVFLSLLESKRAATLKRIECEYHYIQ